MADPSVVEMRRQIEEEVRARIAEEMTMSPRSMAVKPAPHIESYESVGGRRQQIFQCGLCPGSIFRHKSALNRHKKAKHTAGGRLRFQCPYCSHTGNRPDDVVYKHMKNRHPNSPFVPVAAIRAVTSSSLPFDKKTSSCSIPPPPKATTSSTVVKPEERDEEDEPEEVVPGKIVLPVSHAGKGLQIIRRFNEEGSQTERSVSSTATQATPKQPITKESSTQAAMGQESYADRQPNLRPYLMKRKKTTTTYPDGRKVMIEEDVYGYFPDGPPVMAKEHWSTEAKNPCMSEGQELTILAKDLAISPMSTLSGYTPSRPELTEETPIKRRRVNTRPLSDSEEE